MLAQGTYDADYIADSRGQVEADIAAFDNARADADSDDHALDDLELSYFAALVLALEMRFVHRKRGREGTDGNALNEVRLLARSLMTNGGRLLEDPAITLDPARSVLGLRPGDDIVVRYEDFVRLSRAFFDELEARYLD
ncbi:hypothetical protein ACT17Q_04450 [Cellulomonas sp. CW35]|uniref:Uncharacterized protein n=1 Tax=Cellulomonas uda TaxID=1714 RepID=A0A4Y3KDE2_CELUD|nr:MULTISPECIES: hypothetical protein [Cellulomonas]NII65079.1 hypothetical protein [Cellulomonas uda]GEA81008.1 hypothetical protein CUD01_14520 [Cellulomonas uda]